MNNYYLFLNKNIESKQNRLNEIINDIYVNGTLAEKEQLIKILNKMINILED